MKEIFIEDFQELKLETIASINLGLGLQEVNPEQLLVLIDFALEAVKTTKDLEGFLSDRLKEISAGTYGLTRQ